MTTVTLYWNHICVLHRQEKAFLEKLTEKLRGEGIALRTRFFGLGYPMHLSEYLAREDAELPDVIVSADLEIFEDPRIYGKLRERLYPAAGVGAADAWLPLRESAALTAARRGEYLLPFVSIPLVYYTREPARCAETALADWEGLSLGGVNNSAGKTVVKAVWQRWGKEAAARFLEKNSVADMPIGAYQSVRTGAAKTALVPSLYALRADEKETFLRIPQEGALLVSSYFCAARTIPEKMARRVAEELLGGALCEFYVSGGDLIVHPAAVAGRSKMESGRCCAPTASWLGTLAPQEFYEVYTKYLETACDPVKKAALG